LSVPRTIAAAVLCRRPVCALALDLSALLAVVELPARAHPRARRVPGAESRFRLVLESRLWRRLFVAHLLARVASSAGDSLPARDAHRLFQLDPLRAVHRACALALCRRLVA